MRQQQSGHRRFWNRVTAWGVALTAALGVANAASAQAQFPAFGVGHNPYPVSNMWGTDGRRWNAVPLRVIPERGQVSDHFAEG